MNPPDLTGSDISGFAESFDVSVANPHLLRFSQICPTALTFDRFLRMTGHTRDSGPVKCNLLP